MSLHSFQIADSQQVHRSARQQSLHSAARIAHRNDDIFIERDGGRFKFVLDYMRDGRVVLPLSINNKT